MASTSKPPPKDKSFLWCNELVRKFLDLLLAYQHKYGRDQQFSWVDLTTQFEEATGKKCGKETLKNKHGQMKDRWKEWKDLKHGETGLGWDPAIGTISATKEWWEKKIKENANYKKFRKKGIPPDLEDLWDQIYGGTVATGQHCVAPSMDPPPVPAPQSSAAAEAYGYVDGQPVDNEYDLGEDFENLATEYGNVDGSFQNIMRGISESSPLSETEPTPVTGSIPRTGSTPVTGSIPMSATTGADPRRKRAASSAPTPTTTKRSNRQSTRSSLYERHVEAVEDTREQIKALMAADEESSNKAECHAQRVMAVVATMVEEGLLVEGSPLWCYAVDALISSDRASTFFLAMPKNSSRLAWLQWHCEKHGGQS